MAHDKPIDTSLRCCGTVSAVRSLEDIPGLGGGENRPPTATLAPDRPALSGGVTAGFRLSPRRRNVVSAGYICPPLSASKSANSCSGIGFAIR